jgi:hypothetical protein
LVVSFTDRAEGHLVTGDPKVGDPTGPSSGSITHESRAGSRKDSTHIPKEIAEFSEGWTNPKVDSLVVARALRPNRVRVVAVQPDVALHGIEGWKHMASALRPALWDEAAADEHRTVRTDDAFAMCRRLAREEGIFSGPSGGGAVAAAIEVARESDGVIVAVVADGGERYLSTPLWE